MGKLKDDRKLSALLPRDVETPIASMSEAVAALPPEDAPLVRTLPPEQYRPPAQRGLNGAGNLERAMAAVLAEAHYNGALEGIALIANKLPYLDMVQLAEEILGKEAEAAEVDALAKRIAVWARRRPELLTQQRLLPLEAEAEEPPELNS